MLILKDASIDEILLFLDKAEHAGQNVTTIIAPLVDISGQDADDPSTHTVAFEARQLKNLFLNLQSS